MGLYILQYAPEPILDLTVNYKVIKSNVVEIDPKLFASAKRNSLVKKYATPHNHQGHPGQHGHYIHLREQEQHGHNRHYSNKVITVIKIIKDIPVSMP
jgi:hypothetical protein